MTGAEVVALLQQGAADALTIAGGVLAAIVGVRALRFLGNTVIFGGPYR